MSNNLDKIKKLAAKINKQYGSDTLVVGSDLQDFETLNTPFAAVNAATRGIPRGRFTTIAGPEHTGKGAFLVQTIAYNQQKDPNFVAMWSDFENSFDKNWAKQLGVDLDRVIFHNYTREVHTMEKMMDIALEYLKSEAIDMWVIDSIGAMLPKGDVYSGKEEKSLEDQNMLNLQRKLGEFYRKANVIINRNPATGYKGCAVVLVGQVYTVPSANVTLEEVKGGNAVKHWAHLRLRFKRAPKNDWPKPVKVRSIDGKLREKHPGWAVTIKIDKTRQNAAESQEMQLPFFFGRGFDSVISTISAALSLDIIVRKGAYYNCQDLSVNVQGKEDLIKLFTEDNNLLVKLGEIVDTVSLEKGIARQEIDEEDDNSSSEE